MRKPTVFVRRLMRAAEMASAERRLALKALAALAEARLTLAFLPFPKAMARFGLHVGRTEAAAPNPEIARAISVAVRRAAGVAPFRAVCLQQAVAAALLLRRLGQPVEVHFGVAHDEAGLGAHAWAICDGFVVTGGEQRDAFTPIAVFTP